MMSISKNRFLKTTSLLTALLFSVEQIVLAAPDAILESLIAPNASSLKREVTLEEANRELELEEVSASSRQSMNEFDPKPLTAKDYSYRINPAGVDRERFDDAMDLLQPEYAAAAVVKAPREKDLKELAQLSFEVGIAVIRGEIVMFSSGNENELRVSEPAKQILDQASFMAHTHTGHSEDGDEGPSALDLAMAGEKTEYLITAGKVTSYNQTGVLEEITFTEFVKRLRRQAAEDRLEMRQGISGRERNQSVLMDVRKTLNQFIREMDELNESREDSEIFRANITAPDISDDFNGRTTIGTGWSVVSGSFSVTGDKLKQNSSTPSLGIIVRTEAFAQQNYEIEAEAEFWTGYKGLVFRYQNASNYYFLRVPKSGAASIQKVSGGVTSQVGTSFNVADVAYGTVRKLGVVVDGGKFDIYINGVLMHSVTDSTPLTGGSAGLYGSASTGQRFDNFKIQYLNAAPAPPAVPAVNALAQYTNQNSITLSGTKSAGTSIWINGVQEVAGDSQTTWQKEITLSSDQVYNFSITSKNASGLESTAAQVSTTRDTGIPSGSVVIKNADAYTNQTSVALTLTASDALSGLDQIRISSDNGTTWGAWETFAASKTVSLPTGDGVKTVQLQVRDKAGNVATFSDTITLDSTPPTISAVTSSSVTASEAVISWTTNEPSDSQIEYRIQGSTTWLTNTLNATPLTNHSMTLSGLTAGSVYEYRVKSTDQAGNLWVQQTPASFTTTAQAPPPTQTVFTDDFNNRSVLGADWTVVKGQWAVASNQLKHNGTSTNGIGWLIWNQALGSNDYEVEANFFYSTGSQARGVFARYQDSSNYYYGTVTRTGIRQILRVQNGVSTVIASSSGSWFSGNTWHKVSMKAEGNSLKLYLDGIEVASATDNTFSSGKVGLYSAMYANPVDDFKVTALNVAPPVTVVTLSDSTKLTKTGSVVTEEITPSNDRIIFTADGSVESYQIAGASKFVYLNDGTNRILVRDSSGNVIETLTKPAATFYPQTELIKLTLEGGLEAYSKDGNFVEFRTSSGVRITNFTLDTQNQIQDALITYPDGALEVIRSGKRIRRIDADGTIQDFLPSGFMAREISASGTTTQQFIFDKKSQTEINGLKIAGPNGSYALYNGAGILLEAYEAAKGKFVYTVTTNASGHTASLDLTKTTAAQGDKTPTQFVYNLAGELTKVTLKNLTVLDFAAGKLTQARDSSGNIIAYNYTEEDSFLAALTVNRGSDIYRYNQAGFLESIQTAGGTVHRYTDQDVVKLLLETAGGETLTDFELDPENKILNGIITTREGIKQTIQNGVLTGFETVDGRKYLVTGQRADLVSWDKADGTQITFSGGTIQQILFPENRRLHTIGLNAVKEIVSYTEELSDGTKKIFENGKMVKLISSGGHEIVYDALGMAEKIKLSSQPEFLVTYQKDTAGEISKIILENTAKRYEFNAAGSLELLFSQGLGAKFNQQSIDQLFTSFAYVNQPVVTDGKLSGELNFVDGSKVVTLDGNTQKLIRPSGTEVFYQNGQISEIHQGTKIFKLIYQKTGETVTGINLEVYQDGLMVSLPLIPYLLGALKSEAQTEVDNEILDIIFPRPVKDALGDTFEIESEFSNGQVLFFRQLSKDLERNSVYLFGNSYFPEWMQISPYENTLHIQRNVKIGSSNDELPSVVSALVDMNGDGLPDRVRMDDSHTSWWVQINNGQGFEAAVQWNGVDRTIQPTARGSSIRGYGGRMPYVSVDLLDMNGDKRPDRILQKNDRWYVQINTGSGFNAPVLWKGNIFEGYLWYENPSSQGGYNGFSIRARDGAHSNTWSQETLMDLIDMTGDGLPDRIVRPGFAPFNSWFIQRNTGDGFADVELWSGVDSSFDPDAKEGASITFHEIDGWNHYGEKTLLIDMNGDKRPDRLLVRRDASGEMDWYIQMNNGAGFDAAQLWDDNVRRVPGASQAWMGTTLRWFTNGDSERNIFSDIRDVTGDGLPDRVTLNAFSSSNSLAAQNSWWVEVNTGNGFADAVEWTGIYGTNGFETAISQDDENFRSHDCRESCGSGRTPTYLMVYSDLQDLNDDHILDRVIYSQSQNKWLFQLGTGSGFMPVQSLQIENLQTSLEDEAMNTSRYDYLHVSLKAAANLPAASGYVKVSLGNSSDSANYQSWQIQNLTTSWQDIYLPIDKNKTNAGEVKIEFVPAGADPQIPIYVDNMTFTALRPSAPTDWLSRMLTQSNLIADAASESTQTLASLLALREAGSSSAQSFNWKDLLQAEHRIDFDAQGKTTGFETLYGSVSKVENGNVTETTLAGGTKIQFSAPSTANPNQVTQTVTDDSGQTQTISLNYGRVREVVNAAAGKTLYYSYEFNANGEEITVVSDPAAKITERYLENRLISRIDESGFETVFIYDASGSLVKTEIVYKGRVRQSFEHSQSAAGLKQIKTEAGIIEEYDSAGVLRYHITPDGWRYEHSLAKENQITTTFQAQSVTYADGSTQTFQIPIVTYSENPNGADVHRVKLIGYESAAGSAVYDGAYLKSLRLSNGTLITFSRFEEREVLNPETGEMTLSRVLLDASVRYSDGTVTQYRDGLAYSVTSASGKMVSLAKENGLLINPNESAAFHEGQAQKLWNETVLEGWNDFSAPATLTVQSEYSVASGDGVSADELLSRSYAEGAVELYEAGRIQMILGRGGERLVSYSYDGEGSPTRIEMEGSRRRLESQVLKLEAEVALERQKAMAEVASREAVLVQLTEQEYQARRARLLEIRSQIEAQQNYIASISLKGKAAKSALADAAGQIQVGINQVNQALETLAEQRIAQMNNISAQAEAAFQSVKTQAEEALGDIASERAVIEQNILRQELSPVIYHWYRKVMGRDPSKVEYDIEIAKVDYGSGTLDIAALKNQLLGSEEYAARSLEVQQIKDRVTSKLRKAVSGTPAERAAELSALGLSESEVIALTSVESEQILSWLNAQSLHFGQSAFIAFEALQRDAGYSVSRLSLAASLILIDILTGTITPKESGDLVISLYAMRRLAEKRGLANQKSYAVNYEALKQMCSGTVPAGDCPSRVIAHINGNHFVLITKVTDTEITYTDPGAGAENALEVVTVSKEEFLLTWLDPRNPDAGVGYIMTLITPPGLSPQGTVPSASGANAAPFSRRLTSSEEMSVRGAFFPFIAIAIAAVIKAVVAVVVATISAISTLITTLAAGIGNILSGLGSIAQGLFSGNFMAGLTSGFQAISSGMSQIFGSVFQAMGQFGKVFVSTFKAGGFTSIVHGTASGAGNFLSGFMASSAFKGFLATTGIGFGLQGTGQLLSEMGVSPKITNALVSGGKIAVGVGLLATGNPMGLALVTGGASEFLSRHTNLSPTVSALISLGAASVAGFAGGLINTGSIAGSLASLKDITIPYLSKELAVSGFTAIGSSLGLNPAVTSLISVPLRAVAGGISGGSLSPSGILTSIKDALVSSESVGGLISVGAAIGLNNLGAPPILQSFIPNLLAQLTASGSGSTGGGGGPGSILSRIGNFAKNIGQTVVNGAEKVGQTIVSFGQAIANGFGQAVEKVSNLVPPQIKEFFIGKGNGDLAAGVNSVAVTNSNVTESVFGNYRITYSNVSNDLTFANDRLTATVRNVEFGQSGGIFTAGIEISEDFGGGNLVREVYDNNGLLQELSFNDDVEILLNNNPFSKNEPLNFENAVTRLKLSELDSDSFIEFRNVDGELVSDLKIGLDKTVTLQDGIDFVNDIGAKIDSLQEVIGIPDAFADNVTYKGYEPPQGKYAIKIYVDRPGQNLFGDPDKVGVLADGTLDVGHAFVGITDAAGNVTYIGWYPPQGGIQVNGPIDPNNVTLKNLFQNLHVFGSADGRYMDDSKTGEYGDLHHSDVSTDWIEISSEKFDAILGTFTAGGQYSLANSNCTTFVLDVAKTAGVYLPYQPLIFANPQGLADAIEEQQRRDNP